MNPESQQERSISFPMAGKTEDIRKTFPTVWGRRPCVKVRNMRSNISLKTKGAELTSLLSLDESGLRCIFTRGGDGYPSRKQMQEKEALQKQKQEHKADALCMQQQKWEGQQGEGCDHSS